MRLQPALQGPILLTDAHGCFHYAPLLTFFTFVTANETVCLTVATVTDRTPNEDLKIQSVM